MKFRNIKANVIEETEDKAIIDQMSRHPETYEPITDSKPAKTETKGNSKKV